MDIALVDDGLSQLENPSLVAEILLSTASGFFCTRTVILLVGVAATAIVFVLSKSHLPQFRRRKALIPLPSFCSFGEDDDEDISLSHSDGEEEEEETDMEGEDKSGELSDEEVSQVGDFSFTSFSLADLVGGMDVVKPWEGMGLGFDWSDGAVSLFDLSRGESLRSFYSGGKEVRALDLASPAEVVSATDEAGGAVVKVWDVRTGVEAPAVAARSSLRQRVAGIAAGDRKIYVGGDGGDFFALDLRNLAPVELECGEGFVTRCETRRSVSRFNASGF